MKRPALQDTFAPEVMAEINITPFTDVLLVLLVIFLLVASASIFGLNLRLPKAPPENFLQNRLHGVLVTIPSWAAQKQAVVMENHVIHLDALLGVLREERLKKKTSRMVLHVDNAVPYGIVIQVVDIAKAAKLTDIAFAMPTEIR